MRGVYKSILLAFTLICFLGAASSRNKMPDIRSESIAQFQVNAKILVSSIHDFETAIHQIENANPESIKTAETH
ncbi:hypothetical protein [Dyadobacter arcticus]|uniref:Uncharacterized protein n=1 Tax=Dyadobacter arcticus TaxID=1078754 RepID=A0ABX0ULX1_9BACT|nr:hypothetical protein [Dyadobacter arcticus]NIJ53993.1 hypothetical protein [Dyadobacter arcticus]